MKLVKSAIAVGICCFAAQAMAADGEINFTGSVTSNTCSVVVSDVNGGAGGNVSLGNVPSTALKKAGDVAGGGAFQLTLSSADANCVLAGKSATVRFISLNGASGSKGEWIGIAGGAGAAKNVAVQIKDATGADVQLGQASSEYADLTKPLRFTANYIATGVAEAGTANAKAAFSIDYK
ncbi:fimbrial protein [Pseudomonas sp. BGI-2]|uniref:fimbrial protein n=1 Tax=Pseudomonas sp. BGI-2 TaxID=2528211 RepID=UPI001033C68D|nr:fimbrial protein [Pseudomonas sp. BGI-2]TBN40712.1 type 1 fimbrial protein [Pseudomonas sp. BGI-2]